MLRGNRLRTGVVGIVGAAVIAVVVGALAGCAVHSSNASASNSTGPISFASDDPHGTVAALVDQWNAAHPGEQVNLHRLPSQSDAQHADLLANLPKADGGYDLVGLPYTDVAEFAAQGWLRSWTGRDSLDTTALVPAAVAEGSYQGKLFAAPWDVDAGLLYYRRDLVPAAPTSWAQLSAACPTARRLQIGCYAGEFAKGPDLTANVQEAISAAGGQLLRPDGTVGELNSSGVRSGLQLLANRIGDGTIPKAALTYQASQASQAFQSGSLLFMRNWASGYTALSHSKLASKFATAPLPASASQASSAIAGHGLALRTGATHPGTAMAFVRFLQSSTSQHSRLAHDGLAPVTSASYHDAALLADFPQLATLRRALDHPANQSNPDYLAISDAISDSGYAVLSGTEPVPAAITRLKQAISSASG